MAKKKTTPAPVLRTLAGTEPTTPTTATPADDRSERLSIPLTADGNAIDWDRMRPGTRDKLKSLTGSAPGETATTIDPSMVGMIYGSIGMLMVSAARARGFTTEQSSVLIFTDAEKAALVDPTAKVLSKYAGSLGRWQDEILLVSLLGTIMMGKLSQLRKPATVIAMVPTTEDATPDAEGGAS